MMFRSPAPTVYLLLTVVVCLSPVQIPASAQVAKAPEAGSVKHATPPVVTPGTPSTAGAVGTPPSDAIVLFDGSDASAWVSRRGEPIPWRVENGYMQVGGGSVETKEGFGDVQLHIEWAAPNPPRGSGQGRGNSGVYLMSTYEVQVLDSYQNETYPDGQAAAVYGQHPPLVNAMRPPGEWQVYDIVFRRPRFDVDGSIRSPATLTVLHNGVLVQNNVSVAGPPEGDDGQGSPSTRLPLVLQDHGDPVRYRNIWVRDLEAP